MKEKIKEIILRLIAVLSIPLGIILLFTVMPIKWILTGKFKFTKEDNPLIYKYIKKLSQL